MQPTLEAITCLSSVAKRLLELKIDTIEKLKNRLADEEDAMNLLEYLGLTELESKQLLLYLDDTNTIQPA